MGINCRSSMHQNDRLIGMKNILLLYNELISTLFEAAYILKICSIIKIII